MHTCSCLVTTLAGAGFLFDSWMCLTAGTVASSLDELTHVHPLVVGPSNVDKPHLSLFFSMQPLFFYLALFLCSGRECRPSWFDPAVVCVEMCVFGSASSPPLPSACAKVAQKWQKYPDF